MYMGAGHDGMVKAILSWSGFVEAEDASRPGRSGDLGVVGRYFFGSETTTKPWQVETEDRTVTAKAKATTETTMNSSNWIFNMQDGKRRVQVGLE
jgi:hypothetical protein